MTRGFALVRALDISSGDVLVGTIDSSTFTQLSVARIADLLKGSVNEFNAGLSNFSGRTLNRSAVRLLSPLDGHMEVWAAGVTYEVSRAGRIEETENASVYEKVYHADRPELFYKSSSWRAVTDGDPVGIRSDSANNTPEPEVGLVLTANGDIAGLTVVNDMSSRTIEGEKPLYLPQAKIYDGSCVVASTIVPVAQVDDTYALNIHMRITRKSETIFDGWASTSRLHRRFRDLAQFLFHDQSFPDGVILATGTCLVPPLDQTTLEGDIVEISVEGIGSIRNTVTAASKVGRWIRDRSTNPLLTFENATQT